MIMRFGPYDSYHIRPIRATPSPTSRASPKESAGLIDTLVQLGKTLGLGTLAEGIEDDVQLDYLREQDCDSG
jgi:EAL domain-containing protein (putative c-di-GMP-specific phosphodiesterase class I)